jgi:hypothetical protein
MGLRHPIKSLDKTIADNRPADIRHRVLMDLDMLDDPKKYTDLTKETNYQPIQSFSWKPFVLVGTGFVVFIVLGLIVCIIGL